MICEYNFFNITKDNINKLSQVAIITKTKNNFFALSVSKIYLTIVR